MKTFNFTEFEKVYEQALQMDPKDKYKKLTELALGIKVSEDLSLDQISLCLKVVALAKTVSYRTSPLNKIFQALINARIIKLGVDIKQLKVVLEKKGNILLETATVCIADKEYFTENYEEDSLISESMKKGERLYFATGSDGIFPVQLRLVNLEYPLFSPGEQNQLAGFSEYYILNVPTGILVVGDMTAPQINVRLEYGQYRVSINVSKKGKYIICLAKLNKPLEYVENNPAIQTIEPYM